VKKKLHEGRELKAEQWLKAMKRTTSKEGYIVSQPRRPQLISPSP
jgi:hypothetical protein